MPVEKVHNLRCPECGASANDSDGEVIDVGE